MSPGRSSGELVALYPPAPQRPKPIRAVRSTLVTTGLVVLRERSLFDRYLAAMPPEHHATVHGLVAGGWLPAEFMHAHYAAWDALGLSQEEIRTIGTSLSTNVGNNMLLALKNLTTGAGVTPWTILGQYGRFWPRAFDGGGVRIERAGPKDATLRFTEIPFARSVFFQGMVLMIHDRALGTFANKVYARIEPSSIRDAAFVMRLAWA